MEPITNGHCTNGEMSCGSNSRPASHRSQSSPCPIPSASTVSSQVLAVGSAMEMDRGSRGSLLEDEKSCLQLISSSVSELELEMSEIDMSDPFSPVSDMYPAGPTIKKNSKQHYR